MKGQGLAVVTFLFGAVTAALQFAYLNGWIAELSDLSPDTPTIYLISTTFLIWVMLTAVTLTQLGKRGLWTLIVAPFALVGPGLMFWLIVSCAQDVRYCP
ncbi:MAG: hypothetical protein ACLFWF_04630 [Alphaproteobacteria bacterium]